MKIALVVSAFPGSGKSYIFNTTTKYKVLDSDSSKFDKSNFPQNYIEHIQANLQSADMIMVSSHKDVREALVAAGIYYVLVYPDISLKDEYLKRYKERGSPEGFIKLIESKWDEWILECQQQTGCKHIVLQAGQFLKDVLK